MVHRISAGSGVLSLLQLLLDHGVTPNVVGEHGRTPLLSSIAQERFGVSRLLLRDSSDTHKRKQKTRSGWLIPTGFSFFNLVVVKTSLTIS
jgi:ankyrin repeat protein